MGSELTKTHGDPAIRWLIRHMIRYPFLFSFFIVTSICSIVLASLSTIYLGKVFDSLTNQAYSEELMDHIAVFSIFLVGAGIFQWLSSFVNLQLRLKVEKDIRNEIYQGLLNQSQAFYSSARNGELMSLATNELRNMSVMFQPGLNMSLRSVLFYIVPH
ncbi:hypothetical protein G4V62_18470 [Bacillaceae bacterium SIJ1]|uniref:ABC transporter transmembrane domain-containing protein n=1 Tax=Litoribacterium kuwaitense TaxID=1398745 RepID=UPI0013ED496F|nr:ABC transporter transmembrane domain-containing protein [Litoribacterium kuwaitense]NGP46826.1 hypothetical protein [Litoribacterium kuwaitense]